VSETARQFVAKAAAKRGGGISIELPFDPNEAWGRKDKHHITGFVNGVKVRGPLVAATESFYLQLGPSWQRDSGIGVDDEVSVELMPEGPQREAMAEDIVTALDAEPAARAFFDSLATFYRKGYLSWVDATKRRPDVRAQRIKELIDLLKAGKKER
jgi:hypothetical protein